MTFLDLSHAIEHGMTTYPGLPGPVICDYLTREDSRAYYTGGTSLKIERIELVGNTGTYVDAPFHRYEDGIDLAELPLEKLANLPGLVVASGERTIGAEAFDGLDVRGRAVLVSTGADRHWCTERYAEEAPHLTAEAAECLRDGGASFVGIDSVNIDALEDTTRPVHSILLEAGIPIGEHLAHLDTIQGAFRFFAVPPKVRAMGTFPVRAFAISDG